MKRNLLNLVAALCFMLGGIPALAAPMFNVRDYGAVGDGKTLDTQAINTAIETAASQGGGTVFFPAGKYASHSIRLKDNICLYIGQGATIYAAPVTDQAGFDAPEPNAHDKYQDFGHSHWQNSLIWGIGLQNISIMGPGLIDGTDGLGRGESKAKGAGNKAIALKLCRNVVIRDVSVLMAGHFAILATGVDNLTIDNMKVDTNRDGFDIDCCRNVRISNCSVNCLNDDAIVLKSSYGLGFMRACENVTITNCQVTGFDPGTFLDGTYQRNIAKAPDREGPTGRIKFGTESNGGFKNITISNCVFERSRGLALEAVDGAAIEDVTITNIAMREISNSCLFIRLGNRNRAPEGTPHSTIRRVTISNIVAYDVDPRYSTLIAGLPGHPIEDLVLSNIRIWYRGGLSLEDAAKQPAEMVNNFFQRGDAKALAPREDPYAVPENEKVYPEPCTFGILPASGMFIRHVKNLTVSDVEIGFMNRDTRPVMVLWDVEGAVFRNTKAERFDKVPFFVLKDVRNFSSENTSGVKDVKKAQISDLSL